jgi:hypothetical protein
MSQKHMSPKTMYGHSCEASLKSHKKLDLWKLQKSLLFSTDGHFVQQSGTCRDMHK